MMDFFLDKDILFRYGRLLLLGHSMPEKQARLMKEIIEGKHMVFISNNTPFALLNYLKFRAQNKYGLNQTEPEADKTVKKFYKNVFGKGKWNLVNLDMGDYEKASMDKYHLWEDAVQYQCALKTNKPFCTSNIKDFSGDEKLKLFIVR